MQLKTQLLLPKEIIKICRVRESELPKFLNKTIAVELFREGMISIGKAAEISGISKHEMMDALASKKIPLHYSGEDLEKDVKTLDAQKS